MVEVLAAAGATVVIDANADYLPTPVVSHAILSHNQSDGLQADGVIITPSHNPPGDGGIKYNPPSGGPAGGEVTTWIQDRANEIMAGDIDSIARTCSTEAIAAGTVIEQDLIGPYVDGLADVIDFDAIRDKGIRLGVDPLGGAAVSVWPLIAERHNLAITIVNDKVDPAFSFMTVDKDGKIRMDCSSPWAMASLIELRDQYDVACGNDPDADRHGIVAPSTGLLNPNHYLTVAVDYLCKNRPNWPAGAGIGKTLVSSAMIDKAAAAAGRSVTEVPVGFKWFVDLLIEGKAVFAGEESAGATLLKKDGSVWTTEKDGIVMCLLAAEICAVTGKDPGQIYADLTEAFSADPLYDRIDAPADKAQKDRLKQLQPTDVTAETLAGDPITAKLTEAPGNNAAIGGLKVTTDYGWFAARPSGTEDIYKIYAESMRDEAHLRSIQKEAQAIVDAALG